MKHKLPWIERALSLYGDALMASKPRTIHGNSVSAMDRETRRRSRMLFRAYNLFDAIAERYSQLESAGFEPTEDDYK